MRRALSFKIESTRCLVPPLFLQKEAARLIAVHKHDFDQGHTLEISRLKEEIKDLTLKVQPDTTQPLTPTQQKTYGEKIRGLTAQIDDLKKKLSVILSLNKELEKRTQESQRTDAPIPPEVSSLLTQITVLNATIESQNIQYQSSLEELTSDHDCLTAGLKSELDSIKSQLADANAILNDKSVEISHLQDSHDAEIACLRKSAIDQATQSQQELDTICAELQDSWPKSSSDLINDLRSELSIQFGVVSTLRCHLSDSKSELNKAEIDMDRLRSDFATCDHQYSATKAKLASCQEELAQSAEAVNRNTDTLLQNTAQIKDLQDELSYQNNRLASAAKETKSVYAQHEDQRQVIHTLRSALKEANDAIQMLKRDGSSSPSAPPTTSEAQCQTTLQCLQSSDGTTQTTRRELNDLMGSMAITPEPDLLTSSTHAEGATGATVPSTHRSDRESMPAPRTSHSISWADSSEREALDPPAHIPPTDQLPLPTDLEFPPANRQRESSSSLDTSNDPETPRVHARRSRSPDIANNYNWYPPANLCYMKPRIHEKPWALFLGDSMFKKMDTANIVSGSSNSRQFHPHTEAVAWECENLAPTLAGYNQANMEGLGLDIIILSMGTNDAARIQKFGGINPDVDLDRLVHIRIEQWPAQILDMYRSLMTCLDQYGKVLFFLPIGIASVSNNDTGISYFHQLAIHFAKQFPRIIIVDNANMIRNNRALPSMICSVNDPHFSERGRSQVIANLKAAMRFTMPALSAYSTTVNDHMMKRRHDPQRPAPHAQFLRRGATHTGIPDPPSPSEEIPPARRPRSSEPAPSTPQETSSVSVGSIVRQCGLDRTYISYATVAGQGACPSALPPQLVKIIPRTISLTHELIHHQ